jgi:hypothetical protein
MFQESAMRQRGRDSEAQRSAGAPAIELRPPPQAPAELTADQAGVWRSLVAHTPPGWFQPESFAMLATLCAVTVELERINREFARFGSGLPRTAKRWKQYKDLTRLRGTLVGQITTLQTKLRLTVQSRIDPVKAGRRVARHLERPTVQPWLDDPAA